MTESEAIKLLKSNRPESGYITLNYLKCNEALKMAINALENQIARKPTKDKYVPEEDFCPMCRTEVTNCNYCPYCGQKLDFEE